MKTFFSFLSLFICLSTTFAQKQDIEVFEKNEGSKVIVTARNTGKADYSVTLTITSKGMVVAPSSKVVSVIPAGFMKEMATLDPIPGESWEYGYQVSFVQSKGNTPASPENTVQPTSKNPETPKQTDASIKTAPELSKAEVVLYSKPGCSRCSFVRQQLTSLKIPFEEYSTTSTSPEINNMWAQLRNSGFAGGSVTMPVVRASGKYYYNIPDLQEFVSKLKKS